MINVKDIVRSSPTVMKMARSARWKLFPGKLEDELKFLPFLVAPDRAAIDVGVNVGIYTQTLIPLCRKVYAVEPNPELVKYLRHAFRGATIIEAAASSESGTVELKLPQHSGLATIEPGNLLNGQSYATVSVAMVRLDDVIDDDVGFMKIDVEGHEADVLNGAIGLIERCRPTLLIEAEERHHSDAVSSICDILKPIGYRGLMVAEGRLEAIERFDPRINQSLTPDEEALLNLGVRPTRYRNNFFFLPT